MRLMPLWCTQLGAMVLMLAMLLTQSLGLLHRSVHTSGHTQDVSHAPHAQHELDQRHAWLEQLFTDHEDGVTCAVYDAQTTIYGGFMPVVQVFIAKAAIQLIAFSQITSTARAAALFEARGPPTAL
jgi:hypothetical protein